MSISTFFSNMAETRELHSDVKMRSRYYKTNYAKAKACVIEYANKNNIEVKHVDDKHKELYLQGRKFHIIVSFIQINPIETSIDFKVETYTLIGLNRPVSKINKFYEALNNQMEFKGVGLHP